MGYKLILQPIFIFATHRQTIYFMNHRLRTMTFEDIPKAMQLKDAAGWNQTTADWARFLSASPEGCFVTEYCGDVIGTSATIVYGGKLAWIGMVIVDKQYRGLGIGTALLERAIRFLDSRSVPTMKLDATPQGKPLYEKFGFISEYDIERWMLHRTTKEKAIENEPLSIEGVLRMDPEIFGANRSGLLCSLAQEAPHLALVDQQEGKITGYSFGRRGSRADHMGPWVARDEDTAERLLNSFLFRSSRDLIFVDCLRLNPWAIPLVKAHGFGLSRPLTRMFRGANTYACRPEVLCATLGPEFG
jgi:GNAT superfamily N-acetyltransferase